MTRGHKRRFADAGDADDIAFDSFAAAACAGK
jgi:hypothetical protein